MFAQLVSIVLLLFIILLGWLGISIGGGSEDFGAANVDIFGASNGVDIFGAGDYNIKAKQGVLPPPVYKIVPKSCLKAVELEPDELAARQRTYAFSRTLLDDMPRLKYRSRKYRPNFVLHMGQRKLLLAEIEFITKYGHMSDKIVYAGASPGTHIQELLEMFPHTFDLYDPREIIWKHPRMTPHREFFTDAVAERYAGKRVLFISDIRTDEEKEGEWDNEIIGNMADQEKWCQIMRPTMASLKFRLSWVVPKQQYFEGTIYLQVWAPKTSTETRLFTNCEKRCEWDCQKYEEQIYTHNAIARPQYYEGFIGDMQIPALIDASTTTTTGGSTKINLAEKPAGIDNCYDCCSEMFIISEYLNSDFSTEYANKVAELAKINLYLGGPVHRQYADKTRIIYAIMQKFSKLLNKGLDTSPHGEYCGKSLTEREQLYLQDHPDELCGHA